MPQPRKVDPNHGVRKRSIRREGQLELRLQLSPLVGVAKLFSGSPCVVMRGSLVLYVYENASLSSEPPPLVLAAPRGVVGMRASL